MNRSRLGRCAVAVAAAVSLTLATTVTASGYGNDKDDPPPNGGGYIAEVDVTVSLDGDTRPGTGSTVTATVPAKCHWEHFTDDPEAFRDVVLDLHSGIGGFWWFIFLYVLLGFSLPNEEALDEAVEIWDEGETPVVWYVLDCVEDVEPEYRQSYIQHCAMLFPELCLPSPFTYAVHQETPPVVVEPEELAVAAREYLHVPEPELDRNPRAAEAGDATLVNFDTWFWVTDPDAVGGDDGALSVRASIPEFDVWAEVTATTPGLALGSPAGEALCEPQRAVRAWEPGASADDACTLRFSRSSVGYPQGFPVTARTEWSAAWTGVDISGTEQSGDLDPLSMENEIGVPVAEMQTVVR